MRLVDLVHLRSLEEPLSETELVVPPAVPAPEVGRRWGRPPAFSFSNAARDAEGGPSVRINWPAEEPLHYMRVVESDLNVTSKRVGVERDGSWIEVDRLERMLFHYTEFPPKPTRSSLQPSITNYFDLEFALHPTEEKPR